MQLTPRQIWQQVASHLLPKVDIPIEINTLCTTDQALEAIRKALLPHDREIMPRHSRPESTRQRLRELALESLRMEMPPRLCLRNATAAADLLLPNPTSQRIRERLRETAKLCHGPESPFCERVIPQRTLASIGGVLTLSAVNSDGDGSEEVIRCEDCLWDTAAYGCVITENILSSGFREHLKGDDHNRYRGWETVTVQVQACFAFSGANVQISTVFQVVPVTSMPRSRSGVILGQKAFMDSLAYRSVPRAILLARGEEVDENVWGDIVVEGILDDEGLEQAVCDYSVVALS
ncbi:uracil DNA glycosylase [Thelotrema lepadinum]|nr:uracil DNA glycosylase [Thelotrema lepadinum]